MTLLTVAAAIGLLAALLVTHTMTDLNTEIAPLNTIVVYTTKVWLRQ